MFVGVNCNDTFTRFTFKPLYVGMSKNISKRCTRHPILNMIRKRVQGKFFKIETYFQRHDSGLREIESDLIAKLNPPFNIQGRTPQL